MSAGLASMLFLSAVILFSFCYVSRFAATCRGAGDSTANMLKYTAYRIRVGASKVASKVQTCASPPAGSRLVTLHDLISGIVFVSVICLNCLVTS